LVPPAEKIAFARKLNPEQLKQLSLKKKEVFLNKSQA
jgi:hypothetical protein